MANSWIVNVMIKVESAIIDFKCFQLTTKSCDGPHCTNAKLNVLIRGVPVSAWYVTVTRSLRAPMNKRSGTWRKRQKMETGILTLLEKVGHLSMLLQIYVTVPSQIQESVRQTFSLQSMASNCHTFSKKNFKKCVYNKTKKEKKCDNLKKKCHNLECDNLRSWTVLYRMSALFWRRVNKYCLLFFGAEKFCTYFIYFNFLIFRFFYYKFGFGFWFSFRKNTIFTKALFLSKFSFF